MVDKIIRVAEGWKNQLRTCQYAGEVVVPEHDMDDLARLVRRYQGSAFQDQVGVCVLVLAVNCMYYDFNESGFWLHFLGRLHMSGVQSNRDRLGKIIEDRLDEFGLLREVREGPWRYVNALKEQCGVTRKEIPRYADILRFFYDRYGWEGLRTIDLTAFRRSISQCCPSDHLFRFLNDRFGWEFTRSVSRTLHQLEHSHLDSDDLSSIKGYHPGFFPDLQRYLTTVPICSSNQSAGLLAIPRLVFIPEFMQIALLFPQDGINQRAYEFEDRVVTSTPLFLQEEGDFRSIYKGRKRDGSSNWSRWLINGWQPRSVPIALFDVEAGWDDRRNIAPGSYYLLAPADREIPDPIITAQFGPVDLPHEDLYYIAYQIEIGEDTNLDFLGTSSRVSPTRTFLSWSSYDNRADECFQANVFPERMPLVF